MPRYYISAKQASKSTVIYTAPSGKKFRFSGGTWTWRNHNPGNLRTGHVSRRYNQIGKAGGFAVFPHYETGLQALIYLLRVHSQNDSINSLARKYASPIENNTAVYAKFLRKHTGVTDSKKVKYFTDAEFNKLWRAITKMEGYKEGKITEIHQITLVKYSKTSIDSYHINKLGWLSKKEAIRLARKGLVDAVVCRSSSGKYYLRSRPDKRRENNFSNLSLQ